MSDSTETDADQRALNAARDRKRRAAMGPPLDMTDATLAALSAASEHDLPAVESFIRDAAGQKGVDLLRATRDG